MVTFLITIVKLLAIILCVATIHEFGHFLASKLQGVGVDEFSIGFGPKIFQKKFKGTMYSLRWIPLGGYCAIEGEEPTEESKNSESSYQNKNALQKIIILVMGVVFNFILAFAVYMGVFLSDDVYTTEITEFSQTSPLIEAGLKEGDIITAINGKKTEIYAQISGISLPRELRDVEIEYERDGQRYTTVAKNAQTLEGKIGVQFRVEESTFTNVVEMVGAGTSATKVGIKSGDRVISIDGVETPDAQAVINEVKYKADKEITVTVDRNGEIKEFKVVPVATPVFNLGVNVKLVKTTIKYAFLETIQNVHNVIGSYAKLFTGEVSISNMSGIVGIGEVVSKSSGILNFFYLMAMISMAVGVANILPFPPLDGGKIVIVLIESVTRKKVSENVELVISYIGLGLLLALTVFVTIKDIIRII